MINAASKNNKEIFPFKLPENFKPSFYGHFINVYNNNLGVFQRRSFSLILPDKVLKEKSEIEKNIKFALNGFLQNQENKYLSISATMIFVFSENDETMEYVKAIAVFSPAGEWSQADNFKSYQENELKIDFLNGAK